MRGSKYRELTCGQRRHAERVPPAAEPAAAPVPPTTAPVQARREVVTLQTTELIPIKVDDLAAEFHRQVVALVPAAPEHLYASKRQTSESLFRLVASNAAFVRREGCRLDLEPRRIETLGQSLPIADDFALLADEGDRVEGTEGPWLEGVAVFE